jgi:hypothetical protein
MTLGFTQQISGKPTNFVEKIWLGLIQFTQVVDHDDLELYLKQCNERKLLWSDELKTKAKLHTIRVDNCNRWKIGMLIHMVIGNQTPDRFQFAPLLPVTRVQTIVIDNWFNHKGEVKIDGRKLTKEETRNLALNDGFDSVEDFWDYFKGLNFTGKLIHWTKLKY